MKQKTKPPLDDTCTNCDYLVKGIKQETSEYPWACRFYHTPLAVSKTPPERPYYCNIDDRITIAKYNQRKESENNEDKV